MENINPAQILNYGVIGLGFLLAFLAYRLLSKEQQLKEPRKNILKAVNVFMGFSIVLCLIGIGSESIKYLVPTTTPSTPETAVDTTKASIKLLSARPNRTTVGGSATSIKAIKNTLENSILPKLIESCFDEKTGQEYFGKVNALIYQGSDGYANNVSIEETNTDDRHYTCIRDIFRGTQFPDPTDKPEDVINGETGKKMLSKPSYWLTVKFQIRK